MTSPYVFMVGCRGSGTTLLECIIDAHPRIVIAPESRWIRRLFVKRKGLNPEGLVTSDLLSRLLELPRFTALGGCREDRLKLLGNGGPVHYSSFVSAIFDLYGEAPGRHRVGDKTPD